MDDQAFQDLLYRLRAGDEAAAEFVRLYKPALRHIIRVQLTDPHLRRLMDSVDFCQSVLARFFLQLTLGELERHRPGQLLRLLTTIGGTR